MIRNNPGELSKVLDIFSEHCINLVDVAAYSPAEAEETPVFIFADVTEHADIEDLLNEVEEKSGYRMVVKRGSVKGLMLDELAFPLYSVPGMRVIVIDGSEFKAMVKGMYEKMSGSPASIYLYYFAYSGGVETARYLKGMIGLSGEALLKEVIKIYMAYGWGRAELIEYSKDFSRLLIRIYDSIECSLFKNRDKPMSHFIRGHLTGLIEGLFNRKINLVETKCIAMGDPYCEFHLKP